MKTTVLAVGLLAVVSLLGGIALAPAAQAHSELTSTDPADGAVLDAPPRQVSFTFNEPLMPDFVRFIGTDPDGSTGDLPVSFVEGNTAGIDWPATAPSGEWRVSYRVVSQDGHPIEGGITFTYGTPNPAPTQGSPTPSPEVSPAADSASPTGWVVAGLAVAAIAIAGVAFALIARRRA